jgi:50S ribosomal protein L16 3-hydroxylase
VISVEVVAFREILQGRSNLADLFFQQKVHVSGLVDATEQLAELILRAVSPFSAVGLAPLVSPMMPQDFLARYWPYEPMVTHGCAARLHEFDALPGLANVDSLLASWRGVVRTFPPGTNSQFHLPHASPTVVPEAARRLYDRGFTLGFNHVELQVSHLRVFLDALRRDLGLPPNAEHRCVVYASPPSLDKSVPALRAGLSAHFDATPTFVLQLRGAKLWQLRRNEHVTCPTSGHTAGGPTNPEVAAVASGPLPTRIPNDAEEVILRAGSVLYLPPGYWHRTVSEEESLSLAFTYSAPSWAGVVAGALRRLLSERVEWRAIALGTVRGAQWAPNAAELRPLLDALPTLAAGLRAERIGGSVAAGPAAEVDLIDLRADLEVLGSRGYAAREGRRKG